MENVIEVRNLVKSYKSFKLNSISFDIPKGMIVGLIGGNGSGKTTIMKCILSLIFKNSGEIHIFSKNNDELTLEEKEKIGVVLDENCLPSNVRVSFLDRIFKNSFKTWNSKKYFELLAKFNVDSSKRVKELSKGMKAKLNIAIALTRDVKVLILDEPVNGLDPLSRDELNDILLNFVKDKEHSVLISSHILSDIEIISDKIIFIDKGSIVKIGSITDFKDKYDVVTLSKEQYDNLNKENVFSHKINGDIYTCLIRKGTVNEYIKCRSASLEDIMVFYLKGIKDEGAFN